VYISKQVFTLELEQLDKKARSKITLIDLAGSEKTQTAKTEGQGLLEGININKSLSCLGQCIAALAKAANKKDAEEANKTQEQKDQEAEEKKAKEEKEKKVHSYECFVCFVIKGIIIT
jgi:ribosomal protein L12E/L44/L45/RPP1/RPP2